jgi:hypothetical protein
MRFELGVDGAIEPHSPRDEDWPWLPERPAAEEYIRRQTTTPGRPPLTEREASRIADLEIDDVRGDAGS